jgi:DNA repair photolyase
MKIKDRDSIKRQVLNSINSPSTLKIPLENNQQVESLKKIIEKFQDNGIKVVIFITPLTEEYTKNLSDSTKKKFKKIIFEIEEQFSLKIYDLTNKYSELDVWHDLDHIAYNEKSMIYTKDLGKIIIFEIDV